MFGVEMDGFDDLEKQLRDLTKGLEGEHNVPLGELLRPDFVRRYTDFDSLESMFEASGFSVETEEDFAAIPDAAWDAFIADRTQFASWEEMQETAATEWLQRKLDS